MDGDDGVGAWGADDVEGEHVRDKKVVGWREGG